MAPVAQFASQTTNLDTFRLTIVSRMRLPETTVLILTTVTSCLFAVPATVQNPGRVSIVQTGLLNKTPLSAKHAIGQPRNSMYILLSVKYAGSILYGPKGMFPTMMHYETWPNYKKKNFRIS